MITNWPAALLITPLILTFGVVAAFYPIFTLKLFWLGFMKSLISDTKLTSKQKKNLSLLEDNPQKFSEQFANDLLLVQVMGFLALIMSGCIIVGMISDILTNITS